MAATKRNKSVWEALEKNLFTGSIDTVPDGFIRQREVRKKWKLSERQTQRKLYDLIDAGKAIARKFYVKRRDGKPDYITHYKLL